MKKFIEETEMVYTKLALSYGYSIEDAQDAVYDAYMSILVRGVEPTFNLGYTIIKNRNMNRLRDMVIGRSSISLINENYLPQKEDMPRVLLGDICPVEPDNVSKLDFEEVLSYMEQSLPPDDYMLIMMRAHGYPYKLLMKKFQLSRGQVLRMIRIIRNHLKARFPHVLTEL